MADSTAHVDVAVRNEDEEKSTNNTIKFFKRTFTFLSNTDATTAKATLASGSLKVTLNEVCIWYCVLLHCHLLGLAILC